MSKDFQQIEWDEALEDDFRQLVRLAVREDLDRGQDWTTVAMVPDGRQGAASVVARQDGVASGLLAAEVLIDEMQADLRLSANVADGDSLVVGQTLAELNGSARDLLTCERILLNFMGRMSGIATLAYRFVERVAGTKARLYDTRKTTPGWRRLEKYATRCGGAHNHRTGLFDAILIKDNHIAFRESSSLSLADAVKDARDFVEATPQVGGERFMIEIEVDSLEQFKRVLPAQPDIVLLDNMTCKQLREAVELRDILAPAVELEASGGVSLDTIQKIAETGVDRISVGALTHSARTLDLGLDWKAF